MTARLPVCLSKIGDVTVVVAPFHSDFLPAMNLPVTTMGLLDHSGELELMPAGIIPMASAVVGVSCRVAIVEKKRDRKLNRVRDVRSCAPCRDTEPRSLESVHTREKDAPTKNARPEREEDGARLAAWLLLDG